MPSCRRDARILLVGQAAVFHLDHPVVYNTVFNAETIETLARGRGPRGLPAGAPRAGASPTSTSTGTRSSATAQPGNYGFTDFVTPERFADWVAAGVLERPMPWDGPGALPHP